METNSVIHDRLTRIADSIGGATPREAKAQAGVGSGLANRLAAITDQQNSISEELSRIERELYT